MLFDLWKMKTAIYTLFCFSRTTAYALRAISYASQSVGPSVRHTGESVKMAEAWRIMQFSPNNSLISLVFTGKISPRNFDAPPHPNKGVKQGRAEKSLFPALCVNISKTVYEIVHSYYYWLIGSCIYAVDWHWNRWPWMTLNCYNLLFIRNFAWFCITGMLNYLALKSEVLVIYNFKPDYSNLRGGVRSHFTLFIKIHFILC